MRLQRERGYKNVEIETFGCSAGCRGGSLLPVGGSPEGGRAALLQGTSYDNRDIYFKQPYSSTARAHFTVTICPQYDARVNPTLTVHMEYSSGSSTSLDMIG